MAKNYKNLTINLKASTADLIKDVTDAVNLLQNNQILVNFNTGDNIANFRGLFDRIMKEVPNIPLQFEYELAKQGYASSKAEYEKIILYRSEDALKSLITDKYLEAVQSKLGITESSQKEIGALLNTLERVINEKNGTSNISIDYEKLFPLIFSTIGKKKSSALYDDFVEWQENSKSHYTYYSQEDFAKAVREIGEFQRLKDSLISKGAVDDYVKINLNIKEQQEAFSSVQTSLDELTSEIISFDRNASGASEKLSVLSKKLKEISGIVDGFGGSSDRKHYVFHVGDLEAAFTDRYSGPSDGYPHMVFNLGTGGYLDGEAIPFGTYGSGTFVSAKIADDMTPGVDGGSKKIYAFDISKLNMLNIKSEKDLQAIDRWLGDLQAFIVNQVINSDEISNMLSSHGVADAESLYALFDKSLFPDISLSFENLLEFISEQVELFKTQTYGMSGYDFEEHSKYSSEAHQMHSISTQFLKKYSPYQGVNFTNIVPSSDGKSPYDGYQLGSVIFDFAKDIAYDYISFDSLSAAKDFELSHQDDIANVHNMQSKTDGISSVLSTTISLAKTLISEIEKSLNSVNTVDTANIVSSVEKASENTEKALEAYKKFMAIVCEIAVLEEDDNFLTTLSDFIGAGSSGIEDLQKSLKAKYGDIDINQILSDMGFTVNDILGLEKSNSSSISSNGFTLMSFMSEKELNDYVKFGQLTGELITSMVDGWSGSTYAIFKDGSTSEAIASTISDAVADAVESVNPSSISESISGISDSLQQGLIDGVTDGVKSIDVDQIAEPVKMTVADAWDAIIHMDIFDGMSPIGIFKDIYSGKLADAISDDGSSLYEAFKTMGYQRPDPNSPIRVIDNIGFVNQGVGVGDRYTVIARAEHYIEKALELKEKMDSFSQSSLYADHIGKIVGVVEDAENGVMYEIQETVSGINTLEDAAGEFVHATEEQIRTAVRTIIDLNNNGLYLDFGGDNVLYDSRSGFNFLDFFTYDRNGDQSTPEQAIESLFEYLQQNTSIDLSGMQSVALDEVEKITKKSIDAITYDGASGDTISPLEKIMKIISSGDPGKKKIGLEDLCRLQEIVDDLTSAAELKSLIDNIDNYIVSVGGNSYGEAIENYLKTRLSNEAIDTVAGGNSEFDKQASYLLDYINDYNNGVIDSGYLLSFIDGLVKKSSNFGAGDIIDLLKSIDHFNVVFGETHGAQLASDYLKKLLETPSLEGGIFFDTDETDNSGGENASQEIQLPEFTLDTSKALEDLSVVLKLLQIIQEKAHIVLEFDTPANTPILTYEDGSEYIVYRGIDNDSMHALRGVGGFNVPYGSSYATDNYSNAYSYAAGGHVFQSHIAAKNPLEIDAKNAGYSSITMDTDSAFFKSIENAISKINDILSIYSLLPDFYSDEYITGLKKKKNLLETAHNKIITGREFVTDEIGRYAEMLGNDVVIFKNIIDSAGGINNEYGGTNILALSPNAYVDPSVVSPDLNKFFDDGLIEAIVKNVMDAIGENGASLRDHLLTEIREFAGKKKDESFNKHDYVSSIIKIVGKALSDELLYSFSYDADDINSYRSAIIKTINTSGIFERVGTLKEFGESAGIFDNNQQQNVQQPVSTNINDALSSSQWSSDSELLELDKIIKKIDDEIIPAIKRKSDEFEINEVGSVRKAVSEELEELKRLTEYILNDVVEAVRKKGNAFEIDEVEAVKRAVNAELGELDKIIQKIKEIEVNAAGISLNINSSPIDININTSKIVTDIATALSAKVFDLNVNPNIQNPSPNAAPQPVAPKAKSQNQKALEEYEKLTSQVKKYWILKKKYESSVVKNGEDKAFIDAFEADLKMAQRGHGKYAIDPKGTKASIAKVKLALADLNSELGSNVPNDYIKTLEEAKKFIEFNYVSDKNQKYTSRFHSEAEALSKNINAILGYDENSGEYDIIKRLINPESVDGALSDISKLLEKIKTLKQEAPLNENKKVKETQVTNLLSKLQKYVGYSAIGGEDREKLKYFIDLLKEMQSHTENKNKADFNGTINNVLSFLGELDEKGLSASNTFGKLTEQLLSTNLGFINQFISLEAWIRYIKAGIQVVSQLDKALTTISYTMDVTSSNLKSMGNDIVGLSKDLNISLQNMESIYQIYANMKTSSDEIKSLATPTAILSNLSGIDSSTAADYIQGVVYQFGLQMSDASSIVDTFDYISSQIGVDYSKGIQSIASAVEASGAVAREAGLSFEQLAAIVATTAETTRQDGSSIGNALKTIITRLSKASNLSDEVDNSTLSKASEALHNIGIEVYNQSGEFRDFDVIIGELASKWDDLSDATRKNISFAIAATRQTNVLSTILKNYSYSVELANGATNNFGSALKNQEKYSESISGKIESIKTNFESFAHMLISSDVIKNILSFIDFITDSLDNFDPTIAIVGLVGLTIAFKKLIVTIPAVAASIAAGTGLLSGGMAQISLAITAAIAAFAVISKVGKYLDDSFSNQDEIDSYTKKINEFGASLEDIESNINKLKNSGSLTLIEEEQLNSLKKAKSELQSIISQRALLAKKEYKKSDGAVYGGLFGDVDIVDAILLIRNQRNELQDTYDATDNDEIRTTLAEQIAHKDEVINDYLNHYTDEIEGAISNFEYMLLDANTSKDLNQKDYKKYVDYIKALYGTESVFDSFDYMSSDAQNYFLDAYFGGSFNIGGLTEEQKNAISSNFKDAYDYIRKNADATIDDLYDYLQTKTKSVSEKWSLSDTNSESVDKFQEKLTSLYGYAGKILSNSLTESEKTDMLQELYKEFGEDVIDRTKPLEDVFQDLIDNQLDKLIDILGENAPVEFLDSIRKQAEKTKKEIEALKKVSSLSNVQAMTSDGLDQLNKIYLDVKDGGDFDFSSILNNESFNNAFASLDSYEKFVNTIANSPKDIAKCQSAFNKLATEYVWSSEALDKVTESTKAATVAMLKQNGIANASEVVDFAINLGNHIEDVRKIINDVTEATKEDADAKLKEIGIANASSLIDAKLALAKMELKDATVEEASKSIDEAAALYKDAAAAETARKYMYALYMQSVDLSKIDLSQKYNRDQLYSIAQAAGTAETYLLALSDAMAKLDGLTYHSESSINKVKEIASYSGNNVIKKAEAVAAKQAAVKMTQDNAAYNMAIKELKEAFNNAMNNSLKVAAIDASGGIDVSFSGHDANSSDTKEVLDWIEVKIKRIEREIENLNKIADGTFRNWQQRTESLNAALSKTTSEISVQAAAYARYIAEAESVGLSAHYKNLVQQGAIDIETITDETLKKQIDDYTTWYEKALDAQDKMYDLVDQLADYAQKKFDNVTKVFEEWTQIIEHQANTIQNNADMQESRGYFVATSYYKELIDLENENMKALQEERSALSSSLEEAVANGHIEKYSEQWYEMYKSILDVDEAIQDSEKSLIDFSNKMREIEWGYFDKMQEYIGLIKDETDFLVDLMSTTTLYEDNGNFTNTGRASVGMHVVNYNVAMEQADMYAEEMKKVAAELANDPNNQTLIDRRNELLNLQRQSIQAAEDEKEAIKSLVSDGYDKMMENVQSLIDKYKELLDEQSDAYDYQKNVAEKAEAVASLRKQLAALQGDDSEENRNKLQQLNKQLTDAEEDLQETEYDRWKSDQQEMLDNFYDGLEEWVNERLDDLNGIVQEQIDATNAAGETIKETINEQSAAVGYNITGALIEALSSNDSGLGQIATFYSESFGTYATSVQGSLTSIKDMIKRMVDASSEIAEYEKAQEEEARRRAEEEAAKEAARLEAERQAEEARKAAEAAANAKTEGGNTSGGTGDTTTSSDASSYSDGSFFIHKSDGYPKGKLDVANSIVDRLKYNDFDSSFAVRAQYYEKMGLGSASSYTGSAAQNRAMIQWMSQNGFKKGSSNVRGKQLAWTQEDGSELIYRSTDGAILTPLGSGDKVFTHEMSENLWNIARGVGQGTVVIPKSGDMNTSVVLDVGGITMNGVNDPVQFANSLTDALKNNTAVKKIITANTIGVAMGKNTLTSQRW